MRVKADSVDKKLGRQRYTAVMEGMFYIHPCPLKIYLDALEVRYVDAMKSDVYVQQDIYLEYEKEKLWITLNMPLRWENMSVSLHLF
jgi:hypothetical protein